MSQQLFQLNCSFHKLNCQTDHFNTVWLISLSAVLSPITVVAIEQISLSLWSKNVPQVPSSLSHEVASKILMPSVLVTVTAYWHLLWSFCNSALYPTLYLLSDKPYVQSVCSCTVSLICHQNSGKADTEVQRHA